MMRENLPKGIKVERETEGTWIKGTESAEEIWKCHRYYNRFRPRLARQEPESGKGSVGRWRAAEKQC